VARLSFLALSNSSAFVPLQVSNLTAWQSDGLAMPRTLANSGRVVVVGEAPLIEALSATDGLRNMALYGNPGTTNIVEACTLLNDGESWLPIPPQVVFTNHCTTIQVPKDANSVIIYRVRKQ
jgi:hypothetical protein